MKRIFVINGYPESGKDTFVNFMVQTYLNVFEYDTVMDYKDIARRYSWWDGVTKTDKARKLISDLKKAAIEYNDTPFKNTKSYIEEKEIFDNYIIFIHCRESDEIKKLQNIPHVKVETILMKRNGTKPANNSSDMSVNMTEYDYIIENNGDGDIDFFDQCRYFIEFDAQTINRYENKRKARNNGNRS